MFVGELLKGHARDLFVPDAEPVALAKQQPEAAVRAARRSIVRVSRDDDGWRVKEIVAARGSALEKMYRIAAAHALDPVFPPAVEAQVAALCAAPGIDDPALVDMTGLPFVTIDGPGTRDLDQAVHIARDGKGWLVRYALADPAHHVRPGTPLFDEALRRGASYYLPGLAIPMLPRTLSEGIVSLNPGVDRRAMVFEMRVDASGHCASTEIVRARIHSRAQLTFAEVQAFLDDPAGAPLPARDAEASIRLLPEVGEARLCDAEERNVIHYRREETEVKLDPQPPMRFVIDYAMRSAVERYNEQLSLMCNVEGARFLEAADGDGVDELVQPVYRVHPRPSPERLMELEALLAALAKRHGVDPEVWAWRSGRNLRDYLEALPHSGRWARLARAIHRQAVLTNVRSTFSEDPGQHYGIGAEVYARFSAPMREFVGVYVHKEAYERLGLMRARRDDDDRALRKRVVEVANAAKLLQKQVTKEANLLVLDELFEGDRKRPRRDRPWRLGTVLGLTRGKAHVMLDEPAIEVKVYSHHLERACQSRVVLSADKVQLEQSDGTPICRLGDAVRVQVIDRERGDARWELALARADDG